MLRNIEAFIAELREYILVRGDLLRLRVIEKSSRLVSWLLILLIGFVVLMFALAFAAFSIAVLLAKVMPLWGACLVVSGLFLILVVLLLIFRKRWFINPTVRILSDILVTNEEDEDEEI
ncbi:MAG: phage holin family protein [Paludibacteraceae bacterium]|nr:phage holin family protein [Paludibacteraceae bacterium]